MDSGKRRQYVAPSIGGASVPKTAAAAAAEAAAKRLISLRRTAVAQQQQDQPEQHGALSGTSSPHISQSFPSADTVNGTTAARSYATLVRPGDGRAPSLEASSSSQASPQCSSASVSPSYSGAPPQQEQPFSPNSLRFLHEGVSDARAAAAAAARRQEYRSFPQMPPDPTAARVRAAAAAAAMSTTAATSPPPAHVNGEQFNSNAGENRAFELPRPESFRAAGHPSSSVAAAAAAAAAAAYMRARGGHLVAPADPNSRTSPTPSSASSPAPTLPQPLSVHDQRPETTGPAAPFARPAPNSSFPSALALCGSTATQRLPARWSPSKREREDSDGTGEPEKTEGVHQRTRQTPKADPSAARQEVGVSKGKDNSADEGSRSSSSASASSASSSSSLATSRDATAATHPTDTSVRHHNGHHPLEVIAAPRLHDSKSETSGADVVASSTGPWGGLERVDPLRMVVPARSLAAVVQRVTTTTTAARAAAPAPSAAERDDEESENIVGTLCLETDTGTAATNEGDWAVRQAAESEKKEAAEEEHSELIRLRAILDVRDHESLERRATKAATLPPPPADFVLDLLQQLPASPRRAVYSCDDCPCTATEGINEEFHDCVQHLMTRIVLRRDGRAGDAAADGNMSPAPSTDATADHVKPAQQRHPRRPDEVTRNMPSDVRDVVAYARFVVQQRQQLQQGHSTIVFANTSSTTAGRGTFASQKETCEEDAMAAAHPQLGSLKAFVEAKLYLMQSTSANPESTPIGQQGEENIASPAGELGGSGGRLAASLGAAHQHFVDVARAASSTRQEKAEAAQQAEQRLATSALSWRETFQTFLQPDRNRLENLSSLDGSWQHLLDRQGASGDVLQRLQQLLLPRDASSANSLRCGQQQQQQQWEWGKMSKKKRKRGRGRAQACQDGRSGGLELPLPPFDSSFPLPMDE
ncbi:hypothetical protein ABB37_05160 [Leptomonas pyrrhocoris]|uniref:Uncharacterized protein n=1 Tax=Leptomonas pyrrhocoris TaxID=157538 RepID=A0A0N0VF49_LEPPY|nr:hypothetical protein ABB37_05160 [Leptomonas pyrrhocoris]KPA80178.1 hypothetical protein ABB37_05160 [Leptomonas pyrrhocoris]|eukprot:XP_015658617.1 hypothetical protein ABB37_05160 [Leptomonas pyrrhocoris]